EVPSSSGGRREPVLEAAGGGVTICDVYLRSGQRHGLIVEPCDEDDVRAHVVDFADQIAQREGDEGAANDGRGISQEMGRAVRNMAGLRVKRERGANGKSIHRDDAEDLFEKSASSQEFVVEVLSLMQIHRRYRREIWYDPSTGKSSMAWLKETFEQVNNGRHPEFSIPSRIEVVVPQRMPGPESLCVRIVDTRGIDDTAARADLDRHMDDPHTLVLLCSSFNDAPCAAAFQVLERAKQAGVRGLEVNTAILVLPRVDEALAVKDESGVRAKTTEDGYEIKEESALDALNRLGLRSVKLRFFNAFTDEPNGVHDLISERLGGIREAFRASIKDAIIGSRSLLLNHKKESVQDASRRAGQMIKTWIGNNRSVPTLSQHVQDNLIAEILRVYAATVKASVRREGKWSKLDYVHSLGRGTRQLAVSALGPRVSAFKSMTETMEANADYGQARGLIRQARSVLDSAYEGMLHELEAKGKESFKEALRLDRSLWGKCEREQGRGYRDRVAQLNRDWFSAEPRKTLEGELLSYAAQEWVGALERLASLVGADNAIATVQPI
ncbi:MAG: hypothetical protein WBW33_02650, partial [Bryobacteraceae bacterium]